MLKQKINILAIIKSDKVFVICFGVLLAFIIMFIIVIGSIEIFGGFTTESGGVITLKDMPFILTMTSAGTIVSSLGIIIRYLYFRDILKKSVLVKGFIKKKYFEKDDVSILITYDYAGEIFLRKKQMAGKYKIPYHMKEGASIGVLINPKRPRQFIIADLYTNIQYFVE